MPDEMIASLHYKDMGKKSFSVFWTIEEAGEPKAAWPAFETEDNPDEFTPYRRMLNVLRRIAENSNEFNGGAITHSSGYKEMAEDLARAALTHGVSLAGAHVQAFVGYAPLTLNRHPWRTCRPSDIKHLTVQCYGGVVREMLNVPPVGH